MLYLVYYDIFENLTAIISIGYRIEIPGVYLDTRRVHFTRPCVAPTYLISIHEFCASIFFRCIVNVYCHLSPRLKSNNIFLETKKFVSIEIYTVGMNQTLVYHQYETRYVQVQYQIVLQREFLYMQFYNTQTKTNETT